MVECFLQISEDADCRAVVLTGAGKIFTAGQHSPLRHFILHHFKSKRHQHEPYPHLMRFIIHKKLKMGSLKFCRKKKSDTYMLPEDSSIYSAMKFSFLK